MKPPLFVVHLVLASYLVASPSERFETIWPGRMLGLHFSSDGRHGMVLGDAGAVLFTEDGGQSWQSSLPLLTREDLMSVSFIDDARGWAVGKWGAVLRTSDGGKSWRKIDQIVRLARGSEPGENLGAVSIVFDLDGSKGYIVSQRSIQGPRQWALWKTDDGGFTWTEEGAHGNVRHDSDGTYSFFDEYPMPIFGPGSRMLFLSEPLVLSSVTWQKTDLGFGKRFSEFHSLRWLPDGASGTLVAASVGYGQKEKLFTILHTSDAGKTWHDIGKFMMPAVSTLGKGCFCALDDTIGLRVNDLQFTADGTVGLRLDSSGKISKSTDGGKTWNLVGGAGEQAEFSQIQLIDKQAGWGLSFAGTPFKIQISANTLTPAYSKPMFTAFKSLHFFGGTGTAVALTIAGEFLRSSDEGRTWTKIPTPRRFNGISFTDSDSPGWAFDETTVYYTDSAGARWQPRAILPIKPPEDLDPLRVMQMADDGRHGWAIGTTFLFTPDGGLNWHAPSQRSKMPDYATVMLSITMEHGVGSPGVRSWSRAMVAQTGPNPPSLPTQSTRETVALFGTLRRSTVPRDVDG